MTTTPRRHVLVTAACTALLAITACSTTDANDEGAATTTQGPTAFDPPTDAAEAIEQATVHVDGALLALSGSAEAQDLDYRAFLGGALLEQFENPPSSAPEQTSTVTIEGAPHVIEAGATTVADGAVPFGAVQLDACLIMSEVVTTIDGEQQPPMSNPQTSFVYTVEYDADLGHWLLLAEERGSSGCDE